MNQKTLLRKIMVIQSDPNLTGTVVALIDLSTVSLNFLLLFPFQPDPFYSFSFGRGGKGNQTSRALIGQVESSAAKCIFNRQ
jgi:hypothetical protein